MVNANKRLAHQKKGGKEWKRERDLYYVIPQLVYFIWKENAPFSFCSKKGIWNYFISFMLV